MPVIIDWLGNLGTMNLNISSLLSLLISVAIAGLIFWLIWWFISYINLPQPIDKVLRVLVALVALIFLINLLLSISGGTPLFRLR